MAEQYQVLAENADHDLCEDADATAFVIFSREKEDWTVYGSATTRAEAETLADRLDLYAGA